jgi:hypothetical protein
MPLLTRPSRPVLAVALSTIATLALGAVGGQAADPFVAGGRSTRQVLVPAAALTPAIRHGRALATALGMPPGNARSERIEDRFDHRTYDEVTTFDASGREVGIARFDLDGSVAMAVSLGWHDPAKAQIGAAAAARRGSTLAAAAGLAVIGLPEVRASAGAGGWTLTWPRIVDGVPVRGDGTRLLVWADGTFHGLTRAERSLAPAPDPLIAAARARSIAEDLITARFADSAPGLHIAAVERAWVAPNDLLGGPLQDAPAEVLRLVWVVRFDADASLADRVRSVEVWVDAGNAGLLGGDVVE